MCAISECSGLTVRMCRLALTIAGRLCDKYQNLMNWLILHLNNRLMGQRLTLNTLQLAFQVGGSTSPSFFRVIGMNYSLHFISFLSEGERARGRERGLGGYLFQGLIAFYFHGLKWFEVQPSMCI